MPEGDTRELVVRFGHEIEGFVKAADRTNYRSSLFDMRKRTLLGMYCLYDHELWYFEEIAKRRDPAELGRSLRRPCSNPFGQLIHAIPWSYLVPRENEIALGRWPTDEQDDETLAWLVRYWADMAAAYRADGTLLPSESGGTQVVLDAPDVELLQRSLDDAPERIDTVQRFVARIEMMNFVISGEIRGRNFYHGPYPSREPGVDLIVQEFTELQHRQQPWIEGLLEFPVSNVAVVREVSGVDMTFDLFGFMVAGEGGYREHIRRAVAITIDDDGVPRPLDDAELEQLGTHAQTAIRGAYARIAEWDDDFRVMYGLYHYLNEVAPFAEVVGAPELSAELRERMEASGERRLADVQSMGDVPPVWARLGRGPGVFTLP